MLGLKVSLCFLSLSFWECVMLIQMNFNLSISLENYWIPARSLPFTQQHNIKHLSLNMWKYFIFNRTHQFASASHCESALGNTRCLLSHYLLSRSCTEPPWECSLKIIIMKGIMKGMFSRGLIKWVLLYFCDLHFSFLSLLKSNLFFNHLFLIHNSHLRVL